MANSKKHILTLLLGMGLLFPGTAALADEEESALSLSIAYAGFAIPDHTPHGATLGIDYERGISDAVWLRASGGGGGMYDAGAPAYVAHAEVGVTYVIDVLRYVPHVDLGIGGIYLGGDNIDSTIKPMIQIGAGLDMLVSRDRSYGVFTRFESYLGRSAFFSLGVRTTWRWGFF